MGAAAVRAMRLTWLSDDAFISFRYARHLVEGHSLVFNPGEAVEGYTNFLWTLLLALGMELGLPPEQLSAVLGIGCYLALIGLLSWAAHSMTRDLDQPSPLLPLAGAGWALHHHASSFATSGLETSLFTLLVSGTLIMAIQASSSRRWMVAGSLGALATLTRPEGALFYGLSTLAAVHGDPTHRRRRVLAVLAPGVVLLLPWLLWKLSLYGTLLPNTWTAKGTVGPRWLQGLAYLSVYFQMYWAILPGWIAALILLRGPHRANSGWNSQRASGLLAGAICLYLLYVIWVGGDFMFSRFCLPVTPLLLLALELSLLRLRPSLQLPLALATALAIGLASRPALDLDESSGLENIVEERDWYPASWVAEAKRQGQVIHQHTAGTDTRVVFYGTQAMLMYYAQVPYALEGHVGLTDRELAQMAPPSGARVGHGQKATLDYLRSRGIDLCFDFRLQQPSTTLTHVDFGSGVSARLLSYRQPLVSILRSQGAVIPDFEAHLDGYLERLDWKDDQRVRRDYAFFEAFYFRHNDDPERQGPFLERLDSMGEAPP